MIYKQKNNLNANGEYFKNFKVNYESNKKDCKVLFIELT